MTPQRRGHPTEAGYVGANVDPLANVRNLRLRLSKLSMTAFHVIGVATKIMRFDHAIAVGEEAPHSGVAPVTSEEELVRRVHETRWTPQYAAASATNHGT